MNLHEKNLSRLRVRIVCAILTAAIGSCGQSWGRFWDTDEKAPGVVNRKVADSGQINCFDLASALTCVAASGTFPGQDGHFIDVPHARSFTGPTRYRDTDDYTTRDNLTNLVWKTCSEGQTGADCQGTGVSPNYGAITVDWNTASGPTCSALNAAGYAGIFDWRLPSIDELRTLFNFAGNNPAMDSGNFPATVSDKYWTATTGSDSAAIAWFVDFAHTGVSSANTDTIAKTNLYRVRCVSGKTAAAATYTDNGDGTITDLSTNLRWQKCGKGNNNDAVCSGGAAGNASWSQALTYCSTLSLAGRAWRLPNEAELLSLVDFNAYLPSINGTYFPNASGNLHWTSTTSSSPGEAQTLTFLRGAIFNQAKTTALEARCVSTGP